MPADAASPPRSLRQQVGALHGKRVSLEPLALEHVDELLAAADVDRTTYTWTAVPADREAMHAYVSTLLDDAAANLVVPFVQRDRGANRLVGCTRFMELEHWTRRPTPDAVEIGGTWLSAAAQRTGINTEAKLLLLTQAFDRWKVGRVAVCTDERNARSRAAIERLGASFEGVLRHNRLSAAPGEAGWLRESAMYSIIDTEWPAIADRLRRRLAAD